MFLRHVVPTAAYAEKVESQNFRIKSWLNSRKGSPAAGLLILYALSVLPGGNGRIFFYRRKNPGNRTGYAKSVQMSQNALSIARIPKNDKHTFFELAESPFETFNALDDMGYVQKKKSPYRGIYAFRSRAVRKKQQRVHPMSERRIRSVMYRHICRICLIGAAVLSSKNKAENVNEYHSENIPSPHYEEGLNLRARYSVSQREGLLCCRQEVTLAIFQPSPLIHASTAADSSSAPSWPL